MNISKKDSESIQNGILRYQKILASAKARDLNESDTVTIITDMLNSRKNFLRNFLTVRFTPPRPELKNCAFWKAAAFARASKIFKIFAHIAAS